MSTAELNPRPVRVSPLIKFGRWTFLIAGISWGIYHQRKFTRIEENLREIEAREKPIRDAKIAAEKKRLADMEMASLEEQMK
ncbi:ATP synthase subunit e, mitochondrial [Diprion similis]|uniref:ATP synthase subunit e, mitochondrial n=1 Tax=Diprion similis TaxID=362088 RepID=UPI001EF7C3F4|nr:ATP synthase subunit e, mitochondrial [Diprion similis]